MSVQLKKVLKEHRLKSCDENLMCIEFDYKVIDYKTTITAHCDKCQIEISVLLIIIIFCDFCLLLILCE
jgi:hypothetical protein